MFFQNFLSSDSISSSLNIKLIILEMSNKCLVSLLINEYWPEFFIQETILEILRIKHKIDRKPIRHLAANIAFLQSLRSYSFSAENEWFKVSF